MLPFIWFCLVAIMIAAYVVLDGFDLGAGALHLLLARTEDERRTVLRTIGPVWDGNEVWLIAGGGTLFFAFPLLYASSFSGFYLPLIIVLWLLVGRGIGVELRTHLDSIVWRGLFDGCFAFSSVLLAVFFGAAFGNVMRGVPLGKDKSFFLPLWTNWAVGPQPGVLDWYTATAGLVALAALTLHGANWIALKTEGELQLRARRSARVLWPIVASLTVAGLVMTLSIRGELLRNYREHPLLFALPLFVAGSLIAMLLCRRARHDAGAFLSSTVYLVAMLAGAASAVYPNLLMSSTDPSLNITVHNAAAGEYSLSVGLVVWLFGMALATAYTVFVYRMFRGKVS